MIVLIYLDSSIVIYLVERHPLYVARIEDALHLALAQQHGCERFWTNDDRLAKAAIGLQIDVLN